jgi:hypothetical protein
MVNRSDPEKHKEQVRRANRARYRAVQLLINDHQEEFDRLYLAQAALEGVEAKPRSRMDASAIQSQIAELEERLARMNSESAESA